MGLMRGGSATGAWTCLCVCVCKPNPNLNLNPNPNANLTLTLLLPHGEQCQRDVECVPAHAAHPRHEDVHGHGQCTLPCLDLSV